MSYESFKLNTFPDFLDAIRSPEATTDLYFYFYEVSLVVCCFTK